MTDNSLSGDVFCCGWQLLTACEVVIKTDCIAFQTISHTCVNCYCLVFEITCRFAYISSTSVPSNAACTKKLSLISRLCCVTGLLLANLKRERCCFDFQMKFGNTCTGTLLERVRSSNNTSEPDNFVGLLHFFLRKSLSKALCLGFKPWPLIR